MARSKTVKSEAYYFEQFLSHFSLPKGKISYGGPSDDKPDLTLKDISSDTILIGIEQTRFYIENGSSVSSEQIQVSRRLEVIKKAEQEYKNRVKGRLRLSICFNKSYPILSIDEVVNKLVSFSVGLCIDSVVDQSLVKPLLIPEIDSVFVQWTVIAPWQLNQVHDVCLTSKEKLQNILDEKNRQAKNYRSCVDLWLLVVIDFGDPGQDQEIDEKIESLVSGCFSKVILFKTVFNQIKEIPCVKPKSNI